MTSPLLGMAKTIHGAFKSIFLDATLTRDGANSGEAYDPDTAAATVYTCKAICEFGAGASGADLAGTTDATFTILANSLSVKPEPLDRLSIPAQSISGVIPADPKAIKSDPALATWQCRVVT